MSAPTADVGDELDLLRRELSAALRLADRFGFSEGICNHFSATVPGDHEPWVPLPA